MTRAKLSDINTKAPCFILVQITFLFPLTNASISISKLLLEWTCNYLFLFTATKVKLCSRYINSRYAKSTPPAHPTC